MLPGGQENIVTEMFLLENVHMGHAAGHSHTRQIVL